MYRYNEVDQRIVDERVAQFRGQVERRLSGELSEEEFRPLRLMNGLYLQRHAYMLRVAVPYGLLSSEQVRMLAHIAREYDRGYAHVTTRQNLQYNWPELAAVPDILADLATVQMHAIQTSGNCVRNITADHLAGVAADELVDPRPYCEILRQWSTFHPEFAYLPRKFKIGVTGSTTDRAAVAFHDIGLKAVRNEAGEIGFTVLVGGGLGRTPVVAPVIREFLPEADLLSYTEAILRVYNLNGDRKKKYRARIKILVRTLGVEEFKRRVEDEWTRIRHGVLRVDPAEVARITADFSPPSYRFDASADVSYVGLAQSDQAFARWLRHNVVGHKVAGYHNVYVSLKSTDRPPGDITADELDAVADLADRHSKGYVRTTHTQNLVLADVENRDLIPLWTALAELDLAVPTINKITDVICCPGLDFCALANAGSIEIAKQITDHFEDLDYVHDLGELKLKMSGCINACGHHHAGHIGILGVDKQGEERYQIMLGGSAEDDASIGKFIGPSLGKTEVAAALDKLVQRYVAAREGSERFLDTYRRIGPTPFKEAVYGA